MTSLSAFFFFLGVGAIPLHMKWLSVFPLRIVATVEPNWLENVIDRNKYVVDSWSSTCDVDYLFVWNYVWADRDYPRISNPIRPVFVAFWQPTCVYPPYSYGVSYISRRACIHVYTLYVYIDTIASRAASQARVAPEFNFFLFLFFDSLHSQVRTCSWPRLRHTGQISNVRHSVFSLFATSLVQPRCEYVNADWLTLTPVCPSYSGVLLCLDWGSIQLSPETEESGKCWL